MANQLPSKEVYKFLEEFQNHEQFVEFARQFLRLKSNVISDIENDYNKRGGREQRFQMICKWKFLKGRPATMDKLREFKRQFVAEDEDDDEVPAENGGNDANARPREARPVQVAEGGERQQLQPQANNDHMQPNAYPQQLGQNHANQGIPPPRNGPVVEQEAEENENPRAFDPGQDPAEHFQRLRI